MGYLVSAVALSFLLLCLNALGIVPLPETIETVVKWTFGLSLVVGAAMFGPQFLVRIFGR